MTKNTKFIIIIKWGALLGAGLSLINLLAFFMQASSNYHFGPVRELLQVLVIVACLYMGIRDLRDKAYDGLIKFTKAFGIGCCIVFIGYIILALYMMLQIGAIEKNGVNQRNLNNIEAAKSKIQKDTITSTELKQYHSDLKKIALAETKKQPGYDTLLVKADSCVVVILKRFEQELSVKCKHDTTHRLYYLDTFDICADQQLRSTIQSMRMNNSEILPISIEAVEVARDSMAENPIWEQRLKSIPVIQYCSVVDAACRSTLPALLYGMMINIFVAMFLYRKEKTICSRNGNDPATADEEPDTENETEVKTEENHSEQ